MDSNKLFEDALQEDIQALLAALSGKPIIGIKRICTGKELPKEIGKCGACPDIYIEDSAGIRYTVKFLRNDKENVERLGRCLQSAVDWDYITQGGAIQGLPESYIILVCSYDYYHAGLAVYEIQDSYGGIAVHDERHIIILNSHYHTANAAPQVIAFLDHIRKAENTEQPNKIG